MPHIPCFRCHSNRATHRLRLPIGARWLCDPCDPAGVTGRPARMADALLLAARARGLDLRDFRRACELLRHAGFGPLETVDHAHAAMLAARARVAAGELAPARAAA